MIDDGQHPFAPVFGPLCALHTSEGHYVELDEPAFRRIGIDAAALVGRPWQEFAPGGEADLEARAIRQAIHASKPVRLPEVKRIWGGRPFLLAVTVTPVRSAGGIQLVRRDADVLGAASACKPKREPDGPMAALRGLAGLP